MTNLVCAFKFNVMVIRHAIILCASIIIFSNTSCFGQAAKFDLNTLTGTYSQKNFSSVFDDNISDSVKIVGLGEVSHGGYEPMAFKANMVKYLIENKGYRKLLIEFSDIGHIRMMRNYLTHQTKNDTSYINHWVKNGEFMNAFAAVLPDMLNWIRHFNDKHPKDMVQFMGFDIRSEQLDIKYILNRYIIPFNYQESQQYVDQLTSNISDSDKVDIINKWFHSNEAALKAKLKSDDFYWLAFYTRNVFNGLNFAIKDSKKDPKDKELSNLFRDSVMAQNVEYLTGNDKAIIWAHNGHTIRSPLKLMGNRLDNCYGKKYYVIATDFSKYAAVDVVNPDTTQTTKKYVPRIYSSSPATAAYQLFNKYGISNGVYFSADLRKLNIDRNINIIDVNGLTGYFSELHNICDALVIFDNIYANPK